MAKNKKNKNTAPQTKVPNQADPTVQNATSMPQKENETLESKELASDSKGLEEASYSDNSDAIMMTKDVEPALAEASASSADSALEAVRKENEMLRAEIATKDKLIQSLQAAKSDSVPDAKVPCSKMSQALNVQEAMMLQGRLQQLRQEQAAADASRDVAWRQLKSVIQEMNHIVSSSKGSESA